MGSPQTEGLKNLSIKAELKRRDQKPYIGAIRGEEVRPKRSMFKGRDEIETRENRIAQLQQNMRKRGQTANPMRQSEYRDEIGKLRDNQVRTYVARKRAEDAQRKRADQASEIISRLPPSALQTRLPRRA